MTPRGFSVTPSQVVPLKDEATLGVEGDALRKEDVLADATGGGLGRPPA
jgi:hypothetical protein